MWIRAASGESSIRSRSVVRCFVVLFHSHEAPSSRETDLFTPTFFRRLPRPIIPCHEDCDPDCARWQMFLSAEWEREPRVVPDDL